MSVITAQGMKLRSLDGKKMLMEEQAREIIHSKRNKGKMLVSLGIFAQ